MKPLNKKKNHAEEISFFITCKNLSRSTICIRHLYLSRSTLPICSKSRRENWTSFNGPLLAPQNVASIVRLGFSRNSSEEHYKMAGGAEESTRWLDG